MDIKIVFDKSTMKAISVVALENAGALNYSSQYYSAIEGEVSFVQNRCLELGISNIDFVALTISGELTNREKVIMNRHFGEEILNDVLEENFALPLTPEEDLAMMQSFGAIETLLRLGAIRTSREMLLWMLQQETPIPGFSNQRIQKYIDKMTNYLGL